MCHVDIASPSGCSRQEGQIYLENIQTLSPVLEPHKAHEPFVADRVHALPIYPAHSAVSTCGPCSRCSLVYLFSFPFGPGYTRGVLQGELEASESIALESRL